MRGATPSCWSGAASSSPASMRRKPSWRDRPNQACPSCAAMAWRLRRSIRCRPSCMPAASNRRGAAGSSSRPSRRSWARARGASSRPRRTCRGAADRIVAQGVVMRSFVYDLLPSRVVFGAGTIDRLADEVKALGAKRALVLSTPGRRKLADEASRRLGVATAGIYAEAVMHVPVETARAARETARRVAADCIVAIGGGSTIGLAKAIAADTKLPSIAVPTTYSGSEMTPIYGITEAGVKRTQRDAKVQPRVVIYDPNLTVGLPAKVS